jgi:hypothetical protein
MRIAETHPMLKSDKKQLVEMPKQAGLHHTAHATHAAHSTHITTTWHWRIFFR